MIEPSNRLSPLSPISHAEPSGAVATSRPRTPEIALFSLVNADQPSPSNRLTDSRHSGRSTSLLNHMSPVGSWTPMTTGNDVVSP